MQNYLTQLVNDLQRAAENLPVKSYYDIPPYAKGIEYEPNSCPFPKEFCVCKDFELDLID